MKDIWRPWLWWTAAAVAAGLLLHLLGSVLTPFLLSALLAYVASPLVNRFERWHIPRTLGVVLVFALFVLVLFGLVAGLIPEFQIQMAAFIARAPGYLVVIQQRWLPWLQRITGGTVQLNMKTLNHALLQHLGGLGSAAGPFLNYVSQSGAHLAIWLLDLVLVPVVTFYLLRDWNLILARAPQLIPQASRGAAVRIARETDSILAALLRGQLSVMLVLALIYSTGLWIVGVGLALPIGLLAGIASFVPYLGFITGLVTAGIAAWLQFQNASVLVWVGLVFGIGQTLESMVLTPYLVGGRIGLHPVAVIFAIMAGGRLFGFMGVLLALPGAAVLSVIWRYVRASSGTDPAGQQ